MHKVYLESIQLFSPNEKKKTLTSSTASFVLSMTWNSILWWSFSFQMLWRWSFEYNDCIPCRPHLAIQKEGPEYYTNCIQWWGTSYLDLGSVEYSFIAIWLTLMILVKAPSMSQKHQLENYSYSIFPCAKKTLWKIWI